MYGRVSEDRAELGVLFVHGIGLQRPGSAIASLAAALYGWLFRWNCPRRISPGLSPALSGAVLPPGPGGEDGPAHVILAARLDLNGGGRDARWLLAESSWADVSGTPRFLDLAHWIWKVSTCLLVLQFVIPMRRHWRQVKADRAGLVPPHRRLASAGVVLGYAVLMGIAAMLSVLLSMLLLVLAVAAKLPIPRIDGAVARVVVKLSAVLGDSYVLAHCPVQFAAMRTRVARDLAWLQDRCDKVAVVAHSQGAAIAHQVLRDGDYDASGLRAFITLGQGISKLHLLQRMDWDPAARGAARWSRLLVTVGLFCAGLPALGAVASRRADAAIFAALAAFPVSLVLVAGGLACVALGVCHAIRAVGEGIEQDLAIRAEAEFPWTDYYASADPVSNGPLLAGTTAVTGDDQAPPGFRILPSRCNEVYNGGSLLTDHNGYLRNEDQLLSGLLNDLAAAAYSEDLGGRCQAQLVSDAELGEASRGRQRLVGWLVAARTLTAGLGIALWWYDPARLLQNPMNRLLHLADPHAGMSDGLARLVAVALIMTMAYIAAGLIPWRIMEGRAVRQFFHAAQRCSEEPEPGEPAGHAAEKETSAAFR